jgi:glutamate-1-semialdehyde aminotransferase
LDEELSISLDEVTQVIPWGTQTNGKRVPPEFVGVSPEFVERAEGCRFKATNGRWYLDFRSALGPIILGNNYPAVNDAVKTQLDRGVVFSLASLIEYELASLLVETLPGVEQVRFVKSGNEANLAALRLARAYTGREAILACGYHGHGDWFSAGNRPAATLGFNRGGNGVPALLDQLVSWIPYGDVQAAEQFFAERGGSCAAAIMVPYDWGENTAIDFVVRMRELTSEHGAVLIHDEVLTGFRLAYGGARAYYGVEPDLTTYAKAIANGFPLAVFCGKRNVMGMLDKVTISTTHAGETLSIAAALATLRVLSSEPVYEHMETVGRRWMNAFGEVCTRHDVPARLVGLPVAPSLQIDGTSEVREAIRRTLYAGLLQRGVFPSDVSLITFAHTTGDIDEAVAALESTLPAVASVCT